MWLLWGQITWPLSPNLKFLIRQGLQQLLQGEPSSTRYISVGQMTKSWMSRAWWRRLGENRILFLISLSGPDVREQRSNWQTNHIGCLVVASNQTERFLDDLDVLGIVQGSSRSYATWALCLEGTPLVTSIMDLRTLMWWTRHMCQEVGNFVENEVTCLSVFGQKKIVGWWWWVYWKTNRVRFQWQCFLASLFQLQ